MGLAGIGPLAVQDAIGESAALEVGVVHVGDLELSPAGGRELGDDVPDLLVVHVDADDGVVGGRVGGLLDDAAKGAVVGEVGDAV